MKIESLGQWKCFMKFADDDQSIIHTTIIHKTNKNFPDSASFKAFYAFVFVESLTKTEM